MNVEVYHDLESRLREMAERQSSSVAELVEQVLRNYADSTVDAPTT